MIIPVKPPEPYLPTLITEIHSVLADSPHEILVQTEPGLGFAVGCGVKASKGEVVVIMDGDGSHSPTELPQMLSLLDSCDIVVGSKTLQGGSSKDSFTRQLLTKIFNSFTRFLLGTTVHDPMSGFIVAHKSVFKDYVFPSTYKFMLPLYSRNEHRIKEHPITFLPRQSGKSKTSYVTGLRIITQIIRLWRRKHWKTILKFLFFPVECGIIYLLIKFFGWLQFHGLYVDVHLKPLLNNTIQIMIAILIVSVTSARRELRQLYPKEKRVW